MAPGSDRCKPFRLNNKWLNSSIFGLWFRKSPWTQAAPTKSFGIGWSMGRTQPNQRMTSNFLAPSPSFNSDIIWKAKAENKCKFFVWLLVQSKILMADKLTIRGWPHNQDYPLCDQEPERTTHLCLNCVFAKQVWDKVANWTGHTGFGIVTDIDNIADWWTAFSKSVPKQDRRELNAVFIYSCWNIWKERNRHTFQNEALSAQQVLHLIQQEFHPKQRASQQD